MSDLRLQNDAPSVRLILKRGERPPHGIEIPPLLNGELKLLTYLGSRAGIWHSSYSLSLQVYQRNDAAARQLVWKYASMLRRKLANVLPSLVERRRGRGYRCREAIVAIGTGPWLEPSAGASPRVTSSTFSRPASHHAPGLQEDTGEVCIHACDVSLMTNGRPQLPHRFEQCVEARDPFA
jgi:hypothetical protein